MQGCKDKIEALLKERNVKFTLKAELADALLYDLSIAGDCERSLYITSTTLDGYSLYLFYELMTPTEITVKDNLEDVSASDEQLTWTELEDFLHELIDEYEIKDLENVVERMTDEEYAEYQIAQREERVLELQEKAKQWVDGYYIDDETDIKKACISAFLAGWLAHIEYIQENNL